MLGTNLQDLVVKAVVKKVELVMHEQLTSNFSDVCVLLSVWLQLPDLAPPPFTTTMLNNLKTDRSFIFPAWLFSWKYHLTLEQPSYLIVSSTLERAKYPLAIKRLR